MKQPNPPRASRLARFVIACVIALAVMQITPHLGKALRGKTTPPSAEIILLASRIETLDVGAFARQISAPQGTHSLVFIFTSWCPYCQKHAPVIAQLAADYKGKVQVMAISLDKDAVQLASYLAAKPTTLPVQRVDATDGSAFSRAIAATGSQFTGAIPQTILLDSNGRMLAEVAGFVPYPELKSALEKQF